MFFPREKWGESEKTKEGGGGGERRNACYADYFIPHKNARPQLLENSNSSAMIHARGVRLVRASVSPVGLAHCRIIALVEMHHNVN